MDRLILLRHAKAVSEAPSGDDFDRPLAKRGLREAAEMAGRLAELGLRADLALVSPALRTRQTWDAVQEAMPEGEARFDRALYNADADDLRRIAEADGEDYGTVLVVGHNPGLQELAVALLVRAGGPASYIAQAQRAFPPAAVAVFAIDAAGRASAEHLLYPEREG
jgi:phosphohistidine phosphatase